MANDVLYFLENYGYIALFIILIFGIVGLPLPDETLLTFVGYLVSIDRLNYIPSIIIAFIGSISGMSISYFIGHYLGVPFIEKYGGRIGLTSQKLDKVEKWFEKYGRLTITFGYFIPGVRHLTSYSAGISKLPYQSFFMFAFPGGLLWVFTFITLGNLLGDNWYMVSQHMHTVVMVIMFASVIIITPILIFFFIKRTNKERS